MPFGLKNAPSVFQRAINRALGDLTHSYAIVYMDDVMIIARTKEAFERLRIVLQTLTHAGFSFNITKCSFLKSCIEYLGFEVKAGEIRPIPRKIRALLSLPPPQSVTQLRQFIGQVSYFRQFVPNFSELMKPLYGLTSKSKSFLWELEHEQIRQKVISILTNEPVLTIFDPQFSVYKSIKHFRHYLHGRHFVVLTDCNSLKASRTKVELTPRVHRLWSYLQSFEFDIQYRPGERMAHVDFLSRNPGRKTYQSDRNIRQLVIC